MKRIVSVIISILTISLIIAGCSKRKDYTCYVNRFIGSGWHGKVVPAAVVPFGMVQCGPNTGESNSAITIMIPKSWGLAMLIKEDQGAAIFMISYLSR